MHAVEKMKFTTRRRLRPLYVATAWLLMLGFPLQPFLAYLITPILVQDANGQQVVVCTLDGYKLMSADPPRAAQNAGTGEYCPALKLYQLGGNAQLPAPLLAPSASLYVVELRDLTAQQPHRTLHFSAYPARAPPSLS